MGGVKHHFPTHCVCCSAPYGVNPLCLVPGDLVHGRPIASVPSTPSLHTCLLIAPTQGTPREGNMYALVALPGGPPTESSDLGDEPGFVSRMWEAPPQPPELPVAGTPPSYHDLELAAGRGSLATSTEEGRVKLVSTLRGYALLVLAQIVQALVASVTSPLLGVVFHLCLAKKQTVWLVRNGRPVMLERHLRCLETSVVRQRRMSSREHRQVVPSELFAYHRELLGHREFPRSGRSSCSTCSTTPSILATPR